MNLPAGMGTKAVDWMDAVDAAGALGTGGVATGLAGADGDVVPEEPDGFGSQAERTAASPNRGNQRGDKNRFIMRSVKFTEAVGQFGFRI